MSLPPFLFSSATPTTARSAFASTAAPTTTGGADAGGMGTAVDFRQAFMQLTQSKAPLAPTPAAAEAAVDPLLAKLNLLLEGDLLPTELQDSLRRVIEDVQQGVPLEDAGDMALPDLLQQIEFTPDQLNRVTAVVQEAVTELAADEQTLPDIVAALRDLADLLTGGKAMPVASPAGAVNLSEEMAEVDTPVSSVPPSAHLSPEIARPAGGLTAAAMPMDAPQAESGKRLDLNQWIAGQEEEPVSSPALKPELLTGAGKSPGFPADMTLKPDTGASSSLATLLPADLELPEGFNGSATAATPTGSKSSPIAGLQPPADAPLQTAMRVQVAFGHAQWSEAVAERAAWLAGQQIHSAELQLDPPELGPLQVRVSVHQDQAVVSFVSANPQVRDALDQSMVRLRELLQEQGMQLVDAGVSDQQRGDGDNAGGETSDGVAGGSIANDNTEAGQAAGEVLDTRYGVDDFV